MKSTNYKVIDYAVLSRSVSLHQITLRKLVFQTKTMFFGSDLETKFHNIIFIIQEFKNMIYPVFSESLSQVNNFITWYLLPVFP
jgi:hypothetical protein